MSAGVFPYQGTRNSDGTIKVEAITAVVICLESNYQTRCKPAKQLLQSLDAVKSVQSMKAITPADFAVDDVAHPHALTSIGDRANQVSVNDLSNVKQIACALSHIQAWKICVEVGVPILIAEDDLSEYKDQLHKTQSVLNNVPADANFVSLIHLNSDDFKGFFINRLFEDYDKAYPVSRGFYGLQCYVLTPVGASILLAKAMPIVMHIDRYVSDCISTGLTVYRAGKSGAKTNFLDSTLSHNLPTSWSIPIVLIIISLILLCVSIIMGVKLHQKRRL